MPTLQEEAIQHSKRIKQKVGRSPLPTFFRDTLKNCILHFFSTQRQKRGLAFAYKINHLRA